MKKGENSLGLEDTISCCWEKRFLKDGSPISPLSTTDESMIDKDVGKKGIS